MSTYSSLVLGDTSELISLDGSIIGPDLCESLIPSLIPPLLIFDLGNSELFVRRFRKSVLSGPAALIINQTKSSHDYASNNLNRRIVMIRIV